MDLMSCIYLTRACPHRCKYCAIRDSKLQGPELNTEQWKETFRILKKHKVKFLLLLGNELMARNDIVEIMDYLTNEDKTPYAFYSTCSPQLMEKYAKKLVDIGIRNVSSAFDTAPELWDEKTDVFIRKKSKEGFAGMKWFKSNGVPELHGTITASSININYIPKLMDMLTSAGIWCGFNTIHWNKDGGYDFFPPKEKVEHLIPTQEQINKSADEILKKQLSGEIMLQTPPEYIEGWKKHGLNLDWHCSLPLIVSVDADGFMRTCGYRKGKECPKLRIFDLKDSLSRYWKSWKYDQKNCPGCYWACQWQAEFLLSKKDRKEREFGLDVLLKHASKYWRGNRKSP